MGRKKGDSLGGTTLTDWHRQKRKRELQKNKEQRVAARDAKVKETKTSREIERAIQQLERQHKVKEDGPPRPHHVQSKLDRLKKELKLVQQHEQETQSTREKSSLTFQQQQQQQQAAQWKPMDHPQLSVYYDKVLNPYGEPPPGQPRLFHTPDGGTTMDWRQAGLPGQPTLGQLQQQQRQEQQRRENEKRHAKERHDASRAKSKDGRHNNKHTERSESSRLKKDDSKEDGVSCSEGNTSNQQQQRQLQNEEAKSAPVPQHKRPVVVNTSSSGLAASRPKRYGNKQVTDIWALDPEEEESALPSVEDELMIIQQENSKGSLSKQKKKSPQHLPPDDQWFYRDQSGNIQGPYTTDQMRQWISAGFFPPHQHVRSSNATSFQPLQQSILWNTSSMTRTDPSTNNQSAVTSSSVEDRITALKESGAAEASSNANTDETTTAAASSDSVQARIAALRQAHVSDTAPNPSLPEVDDDTDPQHDSVQARIAALKQAHVNDEKQGHAASGTENHEANDDNPAQSNEPSVQNRTAALKAATTYQEIPKEDSVESRIAALKAATVSTSKKGESPAAMDEGGMTEVPYPVPDSGDMADVAYPVPDGGDMADVAYPVPDGGDMADVAYPVPDGGDMADVAYPVPIDNGDMADISYPVNDDEDNAMGVYPIGEDQEPGHPSAYPVGDSYPNDDGDGEDYPVVDSYPVVEAYPIDGDDTESAMPTRKKAKLDKSVISMLPSHLRRKRVDK